MINDRCSWRWTACLGVLLLCTEAAREAWGQDTAAGVQQLALAGPRFLSAAPGAAVVDVRTVPALQRRVTLELERVPLQAALQEISTQAGVHFGASRQHVPLDRPVSMSASHITLAAALFELLAGLGLDVELSPDGTTLVLVPRAAAPAPRRWQATGRLAGRVTDTTTGAPVPNALVILESTRFRAVTGSTGEFATAGVPSGAYAVTARVLGYASRTTRVLVEPDSTTHVTFVLRPVVATLEQVVTTGAGPQRRIELGNAIATINADSVVRTAPVTDLTDLISGRASNVEVNQTSGVVGAGPLIRIRGLSSVSLSNDPIVIIDGVRADATSIDANLATTQLDGHPAPSRLNDIDPTDIETIDILKGPSAATEYGTDAANGVIVVKTKRGHAGPTRWDVVGEQGLSTMPATFPDNYYAWGHTTDGTNTPVQCLLGLAFLSSEGTRGVNCQTDSITHYQPANHQATSLFGTGYRTQLQAQVSGGTSALQYFLSGGHADETGVLRLPPGETNRLLATEPTIPGYTLRPNTATQTSVRARLTSALRSSADVAVSAGYVSNAQRSPDDLNAISGLEDGHGYRDSTDGYLQYSYPAAVFRNTASQNVNRGTTSLTANWRPASWLATRGTAGVDYDNATDLAFVPPGYDPTFVTNGTGYRGDARSQTSVYTMDLGATATASLTRGLGSKTSIGVQYYDTHMTGTVLAAKQLPQGSNGVNGAGAITATNIGDETATLGTYVDETVNVNERLFVGGAARVDAGSGFGKAYRAAVYPKASVSWALSQEPHGLLRLRAAYGQSGVQPQRGAALSLFAPTPAIVRGAQGTGDTLTTLGNPHLAPERQTELEFGLDAGLANGRLSGEFTFYNKVSHDALVTITQPGSVLGGLPEQVNLGSVQNRGVEASVTARVIDTWALAWDATLSGSANANRLVTLGAGVLPIAGIGGAYRQQPGYPIFAYWATTVRYADANHDHIIQPNEVVTTDSASYQGSHMPARQLSLNTGVSLFGNRLRVGGQVDYRGGNKLFNQAIPNRTVYGSTRERNDPAAPLDLQAANIYNQFTGGWPAVWMSPADFVRWRELSVTAFAPQRWTRWLRTRSASLTFLARNLALWTRYNGPDPEVNTVAYYTVGAQNRTFQPVDIGQDLGTLPLARSWGLRLSLGL